MTTMKPSQISDTFSLVEIKPGVKFSVATLQDLLPDVETVLFFGKVYELNAAQLAHLLHLVLDTDLSSALFNEGNAHSSDLQDYVLGYEDDLGYWHPGVVDPVAAEQPRFSPDIPSGEILPEVWKQMEVEIAKSIKEVAAKLEQVVTMLPGKQGSMVFQSMRKLNAKRPTIGDYRAQVHHERVKENLLILDVSGSMNANTISRIIEDVVALSYVANAHMAIVSNSCHYWQPGTYSVQDVLDKAEYGGTRYETLAPLFDRDWGVVITIADFDGSPAAKQVLGQAKGRIDEVLDVSLVNQSTFLGICLAQLASRATPLLIGSSGHILV